MNITIGVGSKSVTMPLDYGFKVALMQIFEERFEKAEKEKDITTMAFIYQQLKKVVDNGPSVFAEYFQLVATEARLYELQSTRSTSSVKTSIKVEGAPGFIASSLQKVKCLFTGSLYVEVDKYSLELLMNRVRQEAPQIY